MDVTHAGFMEFCETRFVLDGATVKLRPDPLGGRFTAAMTPEQAEHLARHIATLAVGARRVRAARLPGLHAADGDAEAALSRCDDLLAAAVRLLTEVGSRAAPGAAALMDDRRHSRRINDAVTFAVAAMDSLGRRGTELP